MVDHARSERMCNTDEIDFAMKKEIAREVSRAVPKCLSFAMFKHLNNDQRKSLSGRRKAWMKRNPKPAGPVKWDYGVQ